MKWKDLEDLYLLLWQFRLDMIHSSAIARSEDGLSMLKYRPQQKQQPHTLECIVRYCWFEESSRG